MTTGGSFPTEAPPVEKKGEKREEMGLQAQNDTLVIHVGQIEGHENQLRRYRT